jgi:hypothetical protein
MRYGFRKRLSVPSFRSNSILRAISTEKPVDAFQTEDTLWAFTQTDQWLHFDFTIGIQYAPEGVGISNENIADTLLKELEKLVVLYRYMKKA